MHPSAFGLAMEAESSTASYILTRHGGVHVRTKVEGGARLHGTRRSIRSGAAHGRPFRVLADGGDVANARSVLGEGLVADLEGRVGRLVPAQWGEVLRRCVGSSLVRAGPNITNPVPRHVLEPRSQPTRHAGI